MDHFDSLWLDSDIISTGVTPGLVEHLRVSNLWVPLLAVSKNVHYLL